MLFRSCFTYDESELRAYLLANPKRKYFVLLKQLTYEEISAFLEMQDDTKNNPNIKGIWFEDEYKRVYPNNSLACDFIGFTGKDNEGSYGIEEFYNDVLNGTNGREYGYLNDDSTLERTTKAAVDGNTVMSTIDANIQSIVEKYILQFNEEHKNEAREGAGSTNTGVIIMNPNNGEILAMASYPTFDLNNPKDLSAFYPEEEIAEMDTETLMEKWNELWRNFCIFNTYEPGSTAKAFTIAAGLEYGKLTGNETYECGGSLQLENNPKPIKCNNRYGHGHLDVSGSLEVSCNVALMKMGFAIGKTTFMEELSNLNFGLKTNVDLAGEARTDTLMFNVDTMVPTDLAISTFGQGYNVTMIQMVSAFSSLINGGNYYEPHAVKKIISPEGATIENIEPRILKQTVSRTTSEKIIQYCDAVVSEGTGKSARPAGYAIGGKTGTAEKYPRGTGNYVVSFMGYAPATNPEILIYVVIDEPNVVDQPHASYATKLTRQILTEVLPYMGIFMTEELTDEEKSELEELKISLLTPIPSDDDGQDDIESEEGSNEQNPTEDEGSAEDNKPQIQINPETGNAIDPLTGEELDPTTGQPIDPTSAGLGGN